ncbi:hypothetical protein [Halalkalicoccus paucihalophilus]|uniref:hypothetical protein n=1 Tax=Halalkalicoccus paucihalophilus TaxID=1008153 RepID=UPI000AFB5475|nr:hypothetical protein [Halalkalicoccus paucihalophilus]
MVSIGGRRLGDHRSNGEGQAFPESAVRPDGATRRHLVGNEKGEQPLPSGCEGFR